MSSKKNPLSSREFRAVIREENGGPIDPVEIDTLRQEQIKKEHDEREQRRLYRKALRDAIRAEKNKIKQETLACWRSLQVPFNAERGPIAYPTQPAPVKSELQKLLEQIVREQQHQERQRRQSKKSSPRPQEIVIEVARKEVETEVAHIAVTPEDLKQDLGQGQGDPVVAHVGSKWEEKPKEVVRVQCSAINKGNKKQCKNTTTDPSGLCGTHCKTHVQLEVKRTEDPIVVKEEPRMLPASEVPIPKVEVVEVNDPLPTNQEVDDCMDDLIEHQVPEEKVTPLSYAELLLLSKEERKRILADRFHCEVENLFDVLLSKRMKFGFHKSKKEEPTEFEVMYFGLEAGEDSAELIGPFTKKADVPSEWIYEAQIHRTSDRIDSYHGVLPYLVIDLGARNWKTVDLPMHTDEDAPSIWHNGTAVKEDKKIQAQIRLFVSLISKHYLKLGALESGVRKGGKVSLILIEDDGLFPDELGHRISLRLGLKLSGSGKCVKRNSQLGRTYHSRGVIGMNFVHLIRLDQVEWSDRDITDAELELITDEHELVLKKIQQIFWNNGYRKETDSPKMRKQFESALDGAGIISRSYVKHSVNWMKHNAVKFGIDAALIHKCEKTNQMSFRGLIPGGGQLKTLMQVSDWLPDGYILFHSTNDKKEWKVEADRPFRYYWDAFEGKPISRTNLQFIIAHRFLFPDELLHRWFDRMCERHIAKLEEKGIVDDRLDMKLSRLSSDDKDGCGLKDGFTSFSRDTATEISEWGFNPLEFPKIATAAAQNSTRSWVKLDTAQLRIEIPGAVHYQIVSQLVAQLTDPDLPAVVRDNGVRFAIERKFAYQKDAHYTITMIDHGGADLDDYYDLIIRQWKDSRVVLRLRAPTRPGEWGIDYLEGDLPEGVEESAIEQIPLPVQDAIKVELDRRIHKLDPIVNPVLPKIERTKQDSYTFSLLHEQIWMPSINPGRLVNLFTDTWIWNREHALLHPPCGMEFLIDVPVQEGLTYGEEGLKLLEKTVVDWYMEAFNTMYDAHDNKLSKCPIDLGFWSRKGIASTFNKESPVHQQIKEMKKQHVGFNWYTNLLDTMNANLSKFQTRIKNWVTAKYLALEEKKFYDNTVELGELCMKERNQVNEFIDLYSNFMSAYWTTKRGVKVRKFLTDALIECGFEVPNTDLPYTNPEVFDRFWIQTTAQKQAKERPQERPWFLDKKSKTNPNPKIYPVGSFDYPWAKETINDGQYTKGKREDIATYVCRTGTGLISSTIYKARPGLASGTFLARSLRACLDTYGNSYGLRVEDFLLEENNWNRFMVWLLLEFEVKGTKQLEVNEPEPKEETPIETETKKEPVERTYLIQSHEFDPLTENGKGGSRTFKTTSRKKLIKRCMEAISWIGENQHRSVSFRNEQKQSIPVQKLLSTLLS